MENCKAQEYLDGLPQGRYVGVDPGENGAFTKLLILDDQYLDWAPTNGVEAYKKWVDAKFSKEKTCLKEVKSRIFVERERVSMLMSPKAATTFMTGYGFCLGVCYSFQIEPTLYDPQEWMKILGLNNLLANPDGSKPTAAQKKRHHTAQIRALWGEYVKDVPDYAVDAYGILLAGLIELSKTKK